MSKYFLALALMLAGAGGISLAVEVDAHVGVGVGGHHRDGYGLRGGKVIMFREGKEVPVTAEVSLNNGVRLLPDGWIIFKDGRRERFVETKWLTLDGDYVAVEDSPDVFEGYIWRDDHVYVIRGGHETLVTVEVTLADGSRLLPDGFIVSREGTRRRMDANARLSLEGKVVEGKGSYHSPADVKSTDTGRRLDDKSRTQTQPANPTDRKADTDRDDKSRTQTQPANPAERKTAPDRDDRTRTQPKPDQNEHNKPVNPEKSEDREKQPAK